MMEDRHDWFWVTGLEWSLSRSKSKRQGGTDRRTVELVHLGIPSTVCLHC